jgi:hypothetical protein
MQYINYGSFIEANEYGDILGNFTAAEYSLNLSYSYALDSLISIGATVRPIYSVLERYTSWGIASDFGIHYRFEPRLRDVRVSPIDANQSDLMISRRFQFSIEAVFVTDALREPVQYLSHVDAASGTINVEGVT